ncbi:MAG: CehA/McbA family metallohydrolase [Devosia sp.]
MRPPLTLTVRVTPTDQARDPYFYVPFAVPEGTTRIGVAMAYAKAEDCIVDLGLFDPRVTDFPSAEGFRGWSGGARENFFVATDDATPGYIHGEMPAGTWQIILGLYKLPPQGADVTLTVALDAAARAIRPQPRRTRPVREGAGWYRGDLHCHTFHSDARGAPELLHAAAKQAGLDFLAVADHNTISQRRYFHPASSPDLVFVRAMEVTTAAGHANVFGVDSWIDFRISRPEHIVMLSDSIHLHGGLFSINHDKPPIPWNYELPPIDCQEVWQSTWLNWNWVALERWQHRLSKGLRISAIGGSDFHQPDRLLPEGPFVLARPTTVLWLDELSEDAVLSAMKAGRGYITENPTGPFLSISANGLPMGSSTAGPLAAAAAIRGAKGDLLHWIDPTGIVAEQVIESDDWVGNYNGLPQKFLRAEIVAKASRDRLIDEINQAVATGRAASEMRRLDFSARPVRRAISNPIYID